MLVSLLRNRLGSAAKRIRRWLVQGIADPLGVVAVMSGPVSSSCQLLGVGALFGRAIALFCVIASGSLLSVAAPSSAFGQASECEQNPFSHKPCLKAVREWTEFADFHNLPRSRFTARIYQRYAEGREKEADDMLAAAQGRGTARRGPSAGWSRLLARRSIGGEAEPCSYNPFGHKPCVDAKRTFEEFAARHNLPNNRTGAKVFEAYTDGNVDLGDRLYAEATGQKVIRYAGPGLGLETLGAAPGHR